MFIGHYGVSFAIKKKETRIPLWLLFVAVQWIDILFFSFVLAGFEHLRLIPGFTAYNPYDLYDMPYTHSLLGSFVLSLIFGLCAALLLRERVSYASAVLWLFLAAFSHFLLDLPVHVKDLLLMPGSTTKLGFGLWNHFYLSMAAEALVFFAGAFCLGLLGRNIRFWTLIVVCTIFLVATPFMPVPQSTLEVGVMGLVGYLIFALLAWWAEPRMISPA